MSAVAGQITLGPLAAARLQTATSSNDTDAHRVPRPSRWSARDALVMVFAAALVALMIVAIGQLLSPTSVDTPPEAVFTVNPDDKEPFFVCTDRTGVRRCVPLELNPAQP